MSKKYELTNQTIVRGGRTLYRIQALRDFGKVKAGDLGGWIKSEDNLSHEGSAWVSGNAQVFGNACIFSNARVFGNARFFGNAKVSGNARVYGDAKVYGDALVSGYAMVFGDTELG
jgi:carbonic anhydrase/acetyltransferase-like protein (isoleucine patch superfamily)